MSTFGWDQMTEWWDEKMGDEGDLRFPCTVSLKPGRLYDCLSLTFLCTESDEEPAIVRLDTGLSWALY